jgi:hypothetical protein
MAFASLAGAKKPGSRCTVAYVVHCHICTCLRTTRFCSKCAARAHRFTASWGTCATGFCVRLLSGLRLRAEKASTAARSEQVRHIAVVAKGDCAPIGTSPSRGCTMEGSKRRKVRHRYMLLQMTQVWVSQPGHMSRAGPAKTPSWQCLHRPEPGVDEAAPDSPFAALIDSRCSFGSSGTNRSSASPACEAVVHTAAGHQF